MASLSKMGVMQFRFFSMCLFALCTALAYACALVDSSDAPPTTTSASSGAVSIELTEFSITASPRVVVPGSTTFDVQNVGEIPHDLIVIRTTLSASELPVDEASRRVPLDELDVLYSSDVMPVGRTSSITLDLQPGRYVLISNIPFHYENGMFVTIDVR